MIYIYNIYGKSFIWSRLFWGVETFRKITGVKNTLVGYAGGRTPNPTYESVCEGNTNHVEVVFIEFDNNIIKFDKLLDYFWKCHDPTTLNRQGPDIGSQYRSAIFYFDENQKKLAENSKESYSKNNNLDVVTEITKAGEFYKAEEYHQKYIQKTGTLCKLA